MNLPEHLPMEDLFTVVVTSTIRLHIVGNLQDLTELCPRAFCGFNAPTCKVHSAAASA